MESTCRFCRHLIAHAATACEHCGAPRTLTTPPAIEPTGPIERTAARGLIARLLGPVHHRWRHVILVATALIGLAVYGLWSLAGCQPLPIIPADASAISVLPRPLRQAATCRAVAPDVDRCVVPPSDALLDGSLTGGEPLTFDVRVVAPAPLADTLRRWRASGTVMLDGEGTFAGLGPTTTIWYADARTGLRIDTSRFLNREAAWKFLGRAGLLP